MEIDVDRAIAAAANILVLRVHGRLLASLTTINAIGTLEGCPEQWEKTLRRPRFSLEIALIIP